MEQGWRFPPGRGHPGLSSLDDAIAPEGQRPTALGGLTSRGCGRGQEHLWPASVLVTLEPPQGECPAGVGGALSGCTPRGLSVAVTAFLQIFGLLL